MKVINDVTGMLIQMVLLGAVGRWPHGFSSSSKETQKENIKPHQTTNLSELCVFRVAFLHSLFHCGAPE